MQKNDTGQQIHNDPEAAVWVTEGIFPRNYYSVELDVLKYANKILQISQ